MPVLASPLHASGPPFVTPPATLVCAVLLPRRACRPVLPPVPPQPQVYNQPQYAGIDLPFDIYTLAVLNSVLMGGVELFRNSELDPERRCYPGGEHRLLGRPAVQVPTQTCA